MKMIHGLVDLARHLGAGDTLPSLERRVYKDTECGAWIRPHMDTTRPRVDLGSIVEGSDAEVGPYSLEFPFSVDEWDETIAMIEAEAEQYWNEAHPDGNP